VRCNFDSYTDNAAGVTKGTGLWDGGGSGASA
jgi:hypothetical protein